MKHSTDSLHCKYRQVQDIKFADQHLTSFAGLVIFQSLFDRLGLKNRIRACFNHIKFHSIYGIRKVVLLLIVHVLLGYRELRDMKYYHSDPMVKRLLGLMRLPDVATVSRTLARCDAQGVQGLRAELQRMVLSRLQQLQPARVSLDFDGSVLSTSRFAEGTAVGFNKKKKGQRSYYPLFCTIAQTGQVFDALFRSGNVHDSNGANDHILQCFSSLRAALPQAKLETRMDSAFFSDEIVSMLDSQGVEFTLSVPFERFPELKGLIENRQRWRGADAHWSYFECSWKPAKWDQRFRFLFIRQRCKQVRKQPVQLDLFVPHQYGYEFKVIVTNKTLRAKKVLAFHNGRGAQEGIFAELKSQAAMAYVPTRTLAGNQVYFLSSLLAHNLVRELHMEAFPKQRNTFHVVGIHPIRYLAPHGHPNRWETHQA